MNKIVYNGNVHEQDLWKLFSDHPDQSSDTILFFCDLKLLLKPMKFEDETRLYHLFEHSTVPAPPSDARWRATVTQKNLRRVANAMSKACQDVAVQYLGANPNGPHVAPELNQ